MLDSLELKPNSEHQFLVPHQELSPLQVHSPLALDHFPHPELLPLVVPQLLDYLHTLLLSVHQNLNQTLKPKLIPKHETENNFFCLILVPVHLVPVLLDQ